jgi:hypothetical protein
MTLPTNNDVANRELSIEELDTIAAAGFGSWLEGEAKSVWHSIEHAGREIASFFAPDIKINVTLGGRPGGGTPYKVS